MLQLQKKESKGEAAASSGNARAAQKMQYHRLAQEGVKKSIDKDPIADLRGLGVR
jgi:hypothetical protein